jgi:hypothetical protein
MSARANPGSLRNRVGDFVGWDVLAGRDTSGGFR